MKKIFDKKTILTIIITITICFGGMVVASAIYHATDVSYTPTNSNWKVSNVNEALDNLYETSTLGDATAEDITTGKTAVVQGELITGNAEEKIFWGNYKQVAEEKTSIAYTGPRSGTITTTYTPNKDCNYIIFNYMTNPVHVANYSYDGSGKPFTFAEFSSDSIFTRIIATLGGFNEKWSLRKGEAKAGETITATIYGYTENSYIDLYNVIYTDENM